MVRLENILANAIHEAKAEITPGSSNPSSQTSVRSESSSITASTLTTESPIRPQKCARTDFGTCSNALPHRLKLDTMHNHLAEPSPRKEGECQLHKWVLQGVKSFRAHGRVKGQLIYCRTCNVILCVRCYKTFHTVFDLDSVKKNIQDAYCKEINGPYYSEENVKIIMTDLGKYSAA